MIALQQCVPGTLHPCDNHANKDLSKVNVKCQTKELNVLKFMFSKKATKIEKKSSPLIGRYVVNVKSMVKVLSIFSGHLRKYELYKDFFFLYNV